MELFKESEVAKKAEVKVDGLRPTQGKRVENQVQYGGQGFKTSSEQDGMGQILTSWMLFIPFSVLFLLEAL